MSLNLDPSVALPPVEGGSVDPSAGLCSMAKGNQTSLLSVGNRMELLQFCSLWCSHYAVLAVECLLCNCQSTSTCGSSPVASICFPLPAVILGMSAFFLRVYLSVLYYSRYDWKNIDCKCSRI